MPMDDDVNPIIVRLNTRWAPNSWIDTTTEFHLRGTVFNISVMGLEWIWYPSIIWRRKGNNSIYVHFSRWFSEFPIKNYHYIDSAAKRALVDQQPIPKTSRLTSPNRARQISTKSSLRSRLCSRKSRPWRLAVSPCISRAWNMLIWVVVIRSYVVIWGYVCVYIYTHDVVMLYVI